MKKVLLIAGFALCASFAFAQTAKVSPKMEQAVVRQGYNTVQVERPRVDYKASIFAKDAATPFASFDFSDTTHGTPGVVLATDQIDDTTVAGSAHANTALGTRFVRVANRAALSQLDTLDYPILTNPSNDSLIQAHMGPDHGINDDNGFMFMDATAGSQTPSDRSAIINAYFTIPQVQAGTDVTMVDLKFHQFASNKRYSHFYVDFKTSPTSNVWYSFEVNTGVDYAVNESIADTCVITLPSEAMSSTRKINLRFRYYSVADNLGVWYSHGYGWSIDNVEFYKAEGARWAFNGMGYIDGFYGMIPEGFNLPLSFIVSAYNTGTVDLEDINIVISHRYWEDGAWVDNDSWSLVQEQEDIPAGTPRQANLLKINERGFMHDSTAFGTWMGAWYHSDPRYMNNTENYGIDPDSMDASWTRRGLPTDHVGKNQFIVKVTASADGETMEQVLDTMTYTVTGLTGGTHNDSIMGLTVPGYRWGNDNGVIPSGSEFGYCLTSGNSYAFDPSLGHQYQAGYSLYNRFVTPDVLPDSTWVFRGMEIIPATNLTDEDIDGHRIAPDEFHWARSATSTSGWGLYTFNSDQWMGTSTYTISGASAALDTLGYKRPDQRYNAINILFPEQPPIYNNIIMFFGYENSETGFFSTARTRGAYKVNADSTAYYSETPDLKDYANQFSPANLYWTAYMYDPTIQDALTGYYFDYYPLIRMIVGPKMEIPKAAVSIICNEDENGEDEEPTSYWVERGIVLCDTVDSIAMDMTYKYEIYPGYTDEDNARGAYSHSVITSIIVDGEEWDLSESAIASNPLITREEYNVINVNHDGLNDEGEEDPNEEEWLPLLERYMYTIYFEDVQGNHTIEAHTAYRELAINEVAPEVKLRLAPNPATSQVRLNIAGVNGKVNCNVIDMSGRVIYSADINAENEHIINLNGVPAGAYFVRITNDTFSKVEKLIVR